MTIETIFITFGAAYLALVAYGVVRTRKRALPVQIRVTASAAQVILPPILMLAALALTGGSGQMIGGWAIMLAMLLVAGALLALCTDIVARRVL